jgi:hypothetical protein
VASREPYYITGSVDRGSDFWTPRLTPENIREPMIAVVGNVLAGLGVLGLFTATLRITRLRPRK